jgi:hypothetical protein
MVAVAGDPRKRSTFGMVDRIEDVTEIAAIYARIGCLVDDMSFDDVVRTIDGADSTRPCGRGGVEPMEISVPYFLPVTSALGILGSAAPDDVYLNQLRLPFDAVTVYFGADLEIPRPLLCRPHDWPPSEHEAELANPLGILGEAAAQVGLPNMTNYGLGRSIAEDIHERGGYLTAVMLLAEPDGRLCDLMGCLVTVDPLGGGTGTPDE